MTDPEAPPPDPLLERLREIAAEVDDPPELVFETGRAALLTRRVDAELAELVMDSAVDELATVRDAATEVRLLSFEAATASVELQVNESGDTRALRGLVRGAVGEVVVETTERTVSVQVDANGWFSVELPAGTVRLHLRDADGTAVTTSWVSI